MTESQSGHSAISGFGASSGWTWSAEQRRQRRQAKKTWGRAWKPTCLCQSVCLLTIAAGNCPGVTGRPQRSGVGDRVHWEAAGSGAGPAGSECRADHLVESVAPTQTNRSCPVFVPWKRLRGSLSTLTPRTLPRMRRQSWGSYNRVRGWSCAAPARRHAPVHAARGSRIRVSSASRVPRPSECGRRDYSRCITRRLSASRHVDSSK